MKIFSFLCLILVSMTSSAQSADEKAVANTVEQLRKAMIDPDRSTLENLTADSLSYGHSTGRVEYRKEFIQNLLSGKSDFVTIDLSDQTISVSGDVAIVRHVLNATTNDSGQPGSTKLLVMLVFQKTKGKWKLLARQAVKAV